MTGVLSDVRTGDMLFFSSNTLTGTVLKTFTSSEFNHVGIAVRTHDGKVVAEKGVMYILEINSNEREEIVSGTCLGGLGLSTYQYTSGKYNKISVRQLREQYRQAVVDKTMEFIHRYHGSPFSSGPVPFLGAWLGIPLVGERDGTEFFCSEMTISYYNFCLQGIEVFKSGPDVHSLYTPGILSQLPSEVFDDQLRRVHHYPCSVITTLSQPIIIILFFVVIIAMLLQGL